jgi:hypothetical protein
MKTGIMEIRQPPPRHPTKGIRITSESGIPSGLELRRLKSQKPRATSQQGIRTMLRGISSSADQKTWAEAYSCQEQAQEPSVKP